MPELPEVENVGRALYTNLRGRRLTGIKVRFAGVLEQSPTAVRRALLGKTLTDVFRHGKYLIVHFDTDTFLMIHLRMTGQIFILDQYRPDKHVHLVFDFDGLPVHYRDIRKFGRLGLVDDGRQPAQIAHVGPDMLAVRFAQWHERIHRRRAPVKALLLDQGIAAGLGNIYVDESLFRAGIHPLTPAIDLTRDELKRVLRCAKSVLRTAIDHGGTTFLNFTNFHGKPGNFRRKLRVYGRASQPCMKCGQMIESIRIAGRSSCFCPCCQPR